MHYPQPELIMKQFLQQYFYKPHQHFQHTQGVQVAAALSYTTLLTIVPMTLLLFFISMQTELFSSMFEQVREQLLLQLLPTSRGQVASYLQQTAQSIKSLSSFNIIIVFLSAIWLSLGVERAFNHIWQAQTPRHLLLRIPTHFILWVMTPFLIMLSLSVSTWLSSLPYLGMLSHQVSGLTHFLPWFISSSALFFLYHFVPNTQVSLRNSATTAVLAGLLFEISKWLFTIFITKFALYEKIYGALAVLPAFMLWIFIAWLIVLWFVSFCVCLESEKKHEQRHQAIP